MRQNHYIKLCGCHTWAINSGVIPIESTQLLYFLQIRQLKGTRMSSVDLIHDGLLPQSSCQDICNTAPNIY